MRYDVWGIVVAGVGLALSSAIQAQDPSEPAPAGDVLAHAEEKLGNVNLQPGKYRAEVTFEGIDIPGAPPEVANMMRSMMSRDFTYCLTPEDVEEGFRAMTDRSQDERSNDCAYERFDVTGGEIDAVLTCNADGRAMRMTMTGTGTPTSSNMTMTMAGDMGMGPGTMTMNVQHERLGPC